MYKTAVCSFCTSRFSLYAVPIPLYKSQSLVVAIPCVWSCTAPRAEAAIMGAATKLALTLLLASVLVHLPAAVAGQKPPSPRRPPPPKPASAPALTVRVTAVADLKLRNVLPSWVVDQALASVIPLEPTGLRCATTAAPTAAVTAAPPLPPPPCPPLPPPLPL